jgi:NTE family protein
VIVVKAHRGLRYLMLAVVGVCCLAGCATRPVTPELTHVDPGAGYRPRFHLEVPDNDPQTILILTFSGGGTRAAAFSYGVLEELRRTIVHAPGRPHPMLDEVDLMTGVSGGSFTALAYSLYGERLFGVYEDAFLRRDVEGELLRRLFNPFYWPRLWTEGFGRSELAAAYYDEILFHGATYGDLLGRTTPRAVAGATDLTTGQRIFFEQGMFDIICADLTKFPLSRAAAASSAVPVVLSPVALDNRGGTCGYRPPPWMTELLKSPEGQHFGNRLAIRARQALQLEDGSARPYIHLVDGGLADNLALLGLIQFLQGFMDDAALRAALDVGSWRRIAIIIVNAQDAPNFDYDKHLDGPGAIALLAQSVSVPMDRYSNASIAALQDMVTEWQLRVRVEADARRLGQGTGSSAGLPAIEFTVVVVNFDAVADPKMREYLQNLPTSFALPEEAVNRLRATGAQVLRDSPAFRKFVESLAQSSR